ncbi:MAG TPA: helix-turn-helix domain-containing protein [Kofleriaceae bacterium]|nr:helix-turn-helix domain-containing protein [Kofleriaceae bacterium]
MQAQPLSDAEYRSLAEFRYQLRTFLAFSEGQARAVGLNPQQHQLLLAVRASAPETPTIGFLAERLILRHHSVVGLLDRLEQRRLVRRVRSARDRRQAGVEITASGARLLHRLAVAHRAELRRARPQLMDALHDLSGIRPTARPPRRTTGATATTRK